MAFLPIIAVSGPHGSGKSTVARKLAEILKYEYIAAGELFREMAKKEGMNLEEFSKRAEQDDEIDNYIDDQTLEIASSRDNLVIDAQLGGWILKDIAHMLIYITAPFETRLKRIAQRENKEIETVKKETLAREESEKGRYLKLYNIDISDLSIYNLILNSEKIDAVECVKKIIEEIEKNIQGEKK